MSTPPRREPFRILPDWLLLTMGVGGFATMFGALACADGRPSLTTAIRVWHDDRRGVTCWIAEGKNDEATIDCLPDSALRNSTGTQQ